MMDEQYDEDLTENKFLREVKRKYEAILRTVSEEDWIVCVPRHGSLPEQVVSKEVVTRHILTPFVSLQEHSLNTFSSFHTLDGRKVILSEGKLNVESTNSPHTSEMSFSCSSRLLFEETFYENENSRKYRVWCIERPLQEEQASTPEYDCLSVKTLEDAVNFLHSQNIPDQILTQFDLSIRKFKDSHCQSLPNEPLKIQRDLVGDLYAKCLRRLGKEGSKLNARLSVETYVLYALRDIVGKCVSAHTAREDANLNRIVRNLDELRTDNFGLRSELLTGIHRGRLELSRLDRFLTVVEKIECLKRAISHATQGVSHVSSDDLLAVLSSLIVETSLSNWTMQLTFMREFRFSKDSACKADQTEFLLTTLEAAIEYVRNHGNVTSISKQLVSCRQPERDCEGSKLERLFACIRRNDSLQVRMLLSAMETLNDDPSQHLSNLCHPLCTCNTCERTLTKETRGRVRVTVHSRDEYGRTAAHIAAYHGCTGILDFLLEHGAEPNVKDINESTPLHCASARGHQSAIPLLLYANADPTVVDLRGNTPLHLAADRGHESCAKALLYFAEQARLLLQVNAINAEGDTPLHRASKWGYQDVVQILLEYGANRNAVNKRGQTALSLTRSVPTSELLQMFRSTEPTVDLQALEPNCRCSFLRSSIPPAVKLKRNRRSSDVSWRGSRCVERLFGAITEGDIRLACYYLGLEGSYRGFRLSREGNACHPLCNCDECSSSEDLAEKRDRARVLPLNVRNDLGEMPLHVACRAAQTDIVQLLLDAGADVNAITRTESRTPLHLACLANSLDIVKSLLNCATCHIDAADCNGNTSLHLLAKTGNTRLVKLLLRHGGSVRIRNSNGLTPLQVVQDRMSNELLSSAFVPTFEMLKKNAAEN